MFVYRLHLVSMFLLSPMAACQSQQEATDDPNAATDLDVTDNDVANSHATENFRASVQLGPKTTTSVTQDEIYDFLVPDVCVDGNGVQTQQNPLNSNDKAAPCARRRQMDPGDFFPYYRTDFLGVNDSYFNSIDPSSNGTDGRVFIFPISKKYDATDQTGTRSTLILQWTNWPLNKMGDSDRFASVHQGGDRVTVGDGVNVLTVRNGFGSLLGGMGYPKISKTAAINWNKSHIACINNGTCTDEEWNKSSSACIEAGSCPKAYTRDDYLIEYALSGGKGFYDYKTGAAPRNAGAALFELAWSFPQKEMPDGTRKAPIFGRDNTLYANLPKKTLELRTDDDNNPIFGLDDLKTPTSSSVVFLTNVGKFRFGPANDYPRITGTRLNHSMEALVQFGFTKSNKYGDGPGRPGADSDLAKQPLTNYPSVSEHTYLTRELGYNTRWELWHGTNIVLRNWDDDERAAVRAYAKSNCTKPANIAGGGTPRIIDALDDNTEGSPLVHDQRARTISPHLAVSNVMIGTSDLEPSDIKGKSFYYQYYYTRDDAGVWHRLRWVMTGCHDSTNVKHDYVNNYIDRTGKIVISSPDEVKVYAEKVPGVVHEPFLNLFKAP